MPNEGTERTERSGTERNEAKSHAIGSIDRNQALFTNRSHHEEALAFSFVVVRDSCNVMLVHGCGCLRPSSSISFRPTTWTRQWMDSSDLHRKCTVPVLSS